MTAAPTGQRPLRRSVRARAVLLIVAVCGVLGGLAVPASAHASFVTSQPEPGAELATTPGVVMLRFSEPLIDDLSQATVVAPAGQEFTGQGRGRARDPGPAVDQRPGRLRGAVDDRLAT